MRRHRVGADDANRMPRSELRPPSTSNPNLPPGRHGTKLAACGSHPTTQAERSESSVSRLTLRKSGFVPKRLRQPVIRYAATQMMDMVHADVCSEPAQNSRQVVMRASTKRRLVKTPVPAMRPERLFELMLYVKQPDSHRAGKNRYR